VKISFTALDSLLQDSMFADAAALDRLAADYPPNRAMLVHLVGLAESGEPTLQVASTALLKRYQERGARFDAQIVGRLLDLLPSAVAWEAVLHVLQMLPRLPIPRRQADALCDALRDLSSRRNKFLRAWAYGGLHHLATEFAEYRSDVLPLLERASYEESASVRARLRQLPPLPAAPKRLIRRRSEPLAAQERRNVKVESRKLKRAATPPMGADLGSR
jgi:hypothetical protein